jgi:Rha family phage regulatory protein
MKELIPRDDFGVFADNKDTARVDSLYVAEFFEKNHKDVLRDIDAILVPDSGFSEEFGRRNFAPTSYKDQWNRRQRCYAMTKDGFTALVMGYTGKKAAHFKELYIKRFNEMENFIKTLQTTRQEFPMLTEQIKLLHENPKPYHYSNEADMLNRLVTGMTTKQFRLANGIEKGQSIRPYLTEEQVHMLDLLQKIDIGLMVGLPNYEDRKQRLEWYVAKMKEAV